MMPSSSSRALLSLISPPWEDLVAEMRFGFPADRLVEGGHSYVHMRALKARCRTVAYDSLPVRAGRIKALLRSGRDFLQALLECLLRARRPHGWVSALGHAAESFLGQDSVEQRLQSSRLPCGCYSLFHTQLVKVPFVAGHMVFCIFGEKYAGRKGRAVAKPAAAALRTMASS